MNLNLFSANFGKKLDTASLFEKNWVFGYYSELNITSNQGYNSTQVLIDSELTNSAFTIRASSLADL